MIQALKIADRLMALASPAAESLSDKLRIDEFVDAAIEAAGALRTLALMTGDTLPATAAILDILNTEALVFPLDAKAKRLAERLALAALASLSLPAPGEGEAKIDAAVEEMAKHLEIDWHDDDEPFIRSDSIDAGVRAILSPTAPDLGAVKDDEDRIDAERWRALMSSQRMHFMGCAGIELVNKPGTTTRKTADLLPVMKPGEYHHFGMEFWSEHKAFGDPQFPDDFERALLTAYVDDLRSRVALEPQTDEMQPDTYTGGDFNGVVRGRRP